MRTDIPHCLLHADGGLPTTHPIVTPLPRPIKEIIFRQFIESQSYHAVNKANNTRFVLERNKVAERITQLHTTRILFPEIADRGIRSGTELGEFNAKIKTIYSILGKEKDYQSIEQKFTGKNKSLCFERFEKHLSNLVSEIMHINPTRELPGFHGHAATKTQCRSAAKCKTIVDALIIIFTTLFIVPVIAWIAYLATKRTPSIFQNIYNAYKTLLPIQAALVANTSHFFNRPITELQHNFTVS